MYNYNVEDKKTYEPIPAGTYKVTLSGEEKLKKDNKTKYLALTLKLDDSNQDKKVVNRLVFDNVYKDKTYTDQYAIYKIKAILLTQGPGVKMTFEDNDELIQFLNGLTMQVEISVEEPNEYHSNPKNVVTRYIANSTFGGNSTVAEQYTDSIAVNDDDLPF